MVSNTILIPFCRVWDRVLYRELWLPLYCYDVCSLVVGLVQLLLHLPPLLHPLLHRPVLQWHSNRQTKVLERVMHRQFYSKREVFGENLFTLTPSFFQCRTSTRKSWFDYQIRKFSTLHLVFSSLRYIWKLYLTTFSFSSVMTTLYTHTHFRLHLHNVVEQ